MDLIGEFHPPSKKGHRYALTVICMLTGYMFCVLLKTKTASEVIQVYIDSVYANLVDHVKYFLIMGQNSRISYLKTWLKN